MAAVVQATIVLFLALTAVVLAHYFLPSNSGKLQQQVRQLSEQVEELQQQQAMPALVLNRYRNSICYIFGIYEVGFPNEHPIQRTRISGSGFLVADGLIATNRHVAEPWYGDPDTDTLVQRGATPRLEKLVAYFPGSPEPITLRTAALSSDGDLALVHFDGATDLNVKPLPLASQTPTAGELVAVVGYPMGVLGMMAKAPTPVYARLAYRHDDQGTASELAALSSNSSFSYLRPPWGCGRRQADLRCTDGSRSQRRPGLQLARRSDRGERRLHRRILRRHAGHFFSGPQAPD